MRDNDPPKCPKCGAPLETYETDWSRATVRMCLKCWFAIKDPNKQFAPPSPDKNGGSDVDA